VQLTNNFMSKTKLLQYKIGATIPTVQYGNIMPELTLEGEDMATLISEGESAIRALWKKYGMAPMTFNEMKGRLVKTFTGEEIYYEDEAHKYTDLDGNPLLSGSAYAAANSPKFDLASMLPKTAKSWGVDERDLGDLWSINGRMSTEYGSGIHSALEAWHRFKELGARIQEHKELAENYALPKCKYLREVVLAFDEKFGVAAMPEVFVSDVKSGRVGQIDRLAITDLEEKRCRIGDYKSNADLDQKKLDHYQKQLSFYAWILMAHGWTVEGLDIFHFDGEWKLIELPVLAEAETVGV
jgi:hypothetical protein